MGAPQTLPADFFNKQEKAPATLPADFFEGAEVLSRVPSWRDDPYAHFLKSAESLLKTPIASHLVGGETVSSIVERHLPAREIGGLKGQAADATRLAAGLADFAGSPEGFANLFLSVATGGAAVPFQATTYASLSGAEIPGLAKKYYNERTPDNLQNLLTAGAFTTGLGAGAGARVPGMKAGLEAGKANLRKIGEALPPVPLVGKAAFEARAVKAIETKASNLAATLEMGGKPAPGVKAYEDIAVDYLKDVREEASRQNIKASQFVGRKGYAVAEKLTGAVRSNMDTSFNGLVDAVKDRPASSAAREAANGFVNEMMADAVLLDAIEKTGNRDKVQSIANRISDAKTIGELDTARRSFNKLAGKYYGKTTEAQYLGSVVDEALNKAADSIREPLYNEIANNYDSLSAARIRDFQNQHGRSIKADNLMKQTATRISSSASAKAAPHTWMGRLREAASGATMGRPIHAAGAVIQREWSPSDVDLFNTRMRRVLDKLEPSKPFRGISPGPPKSLTTGIPPVPEFPMPSSSVAKTIDFSRGAKGKEAPVPAAEATPTGAPGVAPTEEALPPLPTRKPFVLETEATEIARLRNDIRLLSAGKATQISPKTEATMRKLGFDPDAPGATATILDNLRTRLKKLTTIEKVKVATPQGKKGGSEEPPAGAEEFKWSSLSERGTLPRWSSERAPKPSVLPGVPRLKKGRRKPPKS